jgi:heme exporter protein D
MIWNSFSEFAAMGGYGLYVWGSVFVVAGSLAVELALLAVRARSAVAAARGVQP